jgi:Raf kinase inhibitor-like YbhB/YbcL family protein
MEDTFMELRSSAYPEGGTIPARSTCDGENISPALSWEDAPTGTKAFALILHDPDAPRAGGFTHWVVYDVDSRTSQIKENTPRQAKVAGLGMQGRNDSGRIGYMGPCPPSGTQRYIMRLFALDSKIDLKPGALHEQVEASMRGHVVEEATLTATYTREAK